MSAGFNPAVIFCHYGSDEEGFSGNSKNRAVKAAVFIAGSRFYPAGTGRDAALSAVMVVFLPVVMLPPLPVPVQRAHQGWLVENAAQLFH